MGYEKNFENKIKRYLKEQDCWFVKYWGGGNFTKAGVPDLLVCCNGRFIGIEVKAENGKPSDLQLHNIEEIQRAGGIGMLLYPSGFDTLKRIIEELKIL